MLFTYAAVHFTTESAVWIVRFYWLMRRKPWESSLLESDDFLISIMIESVIGVLTGILLGFRRVAEARPAVFRGELWIVAVLAMALDLIRWAMIDLPFDQLLAIPMIFVAMGCAALTVRWYRSKATS